MELATAGVERVNFWNWPSAQRVRGTEPGDLWVIEHRAGHRYHVVVRFNPTDASVTELGHLILRLAEGR